MNELSQVSLSSPSLRGLDLVSSSKALPKGELFRFNPDQVPLPSANSGLTGDISTKVQQTRDEATLADTEAKKLGVDIAKSGFFCEIGIISPNWGRFRGVDCGDRTDRRRRITSAYRLWCGIYPSGGRRWMCIC